MSTFFCIKPQWMKNRVIRYLSVRITDNPLKIWLLIRNPSQPSHTYRPRNLKPLCSMVHFLVLSSHISMTSILPNNTAMLPPFSVFMNFHPNLSDSRSGLISGLELLLHWHTMVAQQLSDTSPRGQHTTQPHTPGAGGSISHASILSHTTFHISVIFFDFVLQNNRNDKKILISCSCTSPSVLYDL